MIKRESSSLISPSNRRLDLHQVRTFQNMLDRRSHQRRPKRSEAKGLLKFLKVQRVQRMMNWRWTCPASPATSTCLMTMKLIQRRKWLLEKIIILRSTACLLKVSRGHRQLQSKRTNNQLLKKRKRNRHQQMTVQVNTREAKKVTEKIKRSKMLLLCLLILPRPNLSLLKRPRQPRRIHLHRFLMTTRMMTILSVASVGTVTT